MKNVQEREKFEENGPYSLLRRTAQKENNFNDPALGEDGMVDTLEGVGRHPDSPHASNLKCFPKPLQKWEGQVTCSQPT